MDELQSIFKKLKTLEKNSDESKMTYNASFKTIQSILDDNKGNSKEVQLLGLALFGHINFRFKNDLKEAEKNFKEAFQVAK